MSKNQWQFDKLFSRIIREMTVGSVFMNTGPDPADPMQGDNLYASGNAMRPNILGTNYNIGDDLGKKKKKKKLPVVKRSKIAM